MTNKYPHLSDLSSTISKNTTHVYPTNQSLLSFDEKRYRSVYETWGTLGLFQMKENEICPLTYGMINYEIEKLDSGLRSAYSVQSSLVIHPIEIFGTDYIKSYFLSDLYSGKKIGCFGLTEPNAGSDPSSMQTKAIRKHDYYIVNGSKTWITNAPIADVFVIWCKDENNKIIGLVADRNEIQEDSLTTSFIHDKGSLLCSPTGSIYFDQLKIPVKHKLTVEGLKGPFTCLNKARYGISWGVIGAMDSCIQTALDYTAERKQFSKSLNSFQLIQKDMVQCVDMYHHSLNAAMASVEQIQSFDQLETNSALISFLKKNNSYHALQVARITRDMLGGNGISNAYPIFRHLNNLEAVNTYEGTRTIHDLILGRHVCGVSAFS